MRGDVIEFLEIISNHCKMSDCKSCEFWDKWLGCFFIRDLPKSWDIDTLR